MILLSLAFSLTACKRQTALVPTPYVMLDEAGRERFAAVPASLQTPEVPIIFFTDRQPEYQKDFIEFGGKRSSAVSFGTAYITTKPATSWDKLVQASTSAKRDRRYSMFLDRIEIAGQISPIENFLTVEDGELAYTKNAWSEFMQEVHDFDKLIAPRLEADPEGEVILFVHGFHNNFDKAAVRLGALWHAGGRVGVPVLYSWPAGYEGFLPFAYNHDRESGEFTIRHLKVMLFALARNDKVKRVHLIAHSRGTDVVVTALREIKNDLWGVYGGSAFSRIALGVAPATHLAPLHEPKSPAQTTKIKTLVLAAADIDRDVFIQRFVVEQVPRLADRTVIYSSPSDFALHISDIFFGSSRRLGQESYEDFQPNIRALLGKMPNIEFIHCELKSANSHAYAFEHPAALSDLIRLIHDDAAAGSPQRPLEPIAPSFWRLNNDYLKPDPKRN